MGIVTEAKTINDVIEGQMTVKDAAAQLDVSSRTIWRKIARYKEGGEAGLVHGLTGKKSNRAKPEELREEVLNQYKERFGNVAISRFAADIAESRGISISRETVRKWLMDAGMWEGKKRTKPDDERLSEECSTLEQIIQ
jgi:transposase